MINKFKIENINNIPMELKRINNWVLYDENKIPKQVSGVNALANNKNTFNTYEKILDAYKNDLNNKYSGIGFMLTQDIKIIALDLDNCIINSELTENAKEIIKKMNTYTEISPSGKGVKVILKINSEKKENVKASKKIKEFDFKELEVINKNKYTTITGNLLQRSYDEIQEREKEFKELFYEYYIKERKEKNINLKTKRAEGEKVPLKIDYIGLDLKELHNKVFYIIKSLKAKNEDFNYYFVNGYKTTDDKSEIDLKIVNLIEPYTRQLKEKEAFYVIDKVMINSKLNRDKWNRIDYKQDTIYKALSRR